MNGGVSYPAGLGKDYIMSNENRPVVVDLGGGLEYGLPSIADAKRIYPAGKIVRYQDGQMIDPEDLTAADVAPSGEVVVSSKLTRDELEAIATGLNIEGADNKTAFHTKDDLVAEILRVREANAASAAGVEGENADANAEGDAAPVADGEGESE